MSETRESEQIDNSTASVGEPCLPMDFNTQKREENKGSLEHGRDNNMQAKKKRKWPLEESKSPKPRFPSPLTHDHKEDKEIPPSLMPLNHK